MKRRRVLLQVAGAVSLTAGCLSNSDLPPGTTSNSTTEPSTQRTTDSTTDTTEAPTTVEQKIETLPKKPPENDVDCSDEDLYTVSGWDRDSYPEQAKGFALEASTDTVTIGGEITFTLTNVSSEQREIGEIYKYTIQQHEDDTWKPIFHTPEPLWTDLAVFVAPDGGYEWPFTFDREGLERQHGPTNASYHMCSPLEPGTYRFVFWGLGNDTEVATRFTVEES
jgi:hypothetical protein